MKPSTAFRIAAVFGCLAVALGAFGAHGLKEILERNQRVANWETAAHYHLIHAVVLLLISRAEGFSRLTWWLFTTGILIFSGSLYILAVTNLKWLGAITPFGGVALIAGWIGLAIRGGRVA